MKPSTVQYQLSTTFCRGTYTLSFFHVFKGEKKGGEHVSNQTAHM